MQPPLPLCVSVDELIGRTTSHCRAPRPAGDSAEGPVGQVNGMGREGRPVGQATVWSSWLGEHARRRALVMGTADSRKGQGQPREIRRPLPGPRTSTRRLTCGRASIHDIRAAQPTPPRPVLLARHDVRPANTSCQRPHRFRWRPVTRIGRRVTERPEGGTVDLIAQGAARTSRVRPRTPVVTTVVTVSGIRRREGTQINVPGPWNRPGPTRLARPTPIRDPIPSPTGRVRSGGQRSDRSDHDRGLDANDQHSASHRRRCQAR